MINTIRGVTGDLVLSNKQLGYEEVLASFVRATSVTVITFNISTKRDTLIEHLRELGVPLRLITNIPSRWTTNDEGQRVLTNAVSDYMERLNPDTFGPAVAISFCFTNHCKVIMTDQIGYIGSANYADESARNWEFGVIIRDPNVLSAISTAIDELERDSVRYHGPSVRDSLAPLLGAAANLQELSKRLGEDFEKVDEHELRDAVEELREAIANSDPAWAEGFDENGPVYGNIDEFLLTTIEDWFDDELCVWELRRADERLKEAEDGDVELPYDNDGNPIDAAQNDMISDRTVEREGCAIKVQNQIQRLQEDIQEVITQIVTVCNEISDCVRKIKDIPETQETDVACPKCGRQMVVRKGKSGTFLACSGYPKCKSAMSLDADGKRRPGATATEHKCAKCGSSMMLQEGRYGKFLGCSRYPDCKTTLKVDAQNNPIKTVDPGVTCKQCGNPMVVRSGSGGQFLGCKTFPKCKYTMDITKELMERIGMPSSG